MHAPAPSLRANHLPHIDGLRAFAVLPIVVFHAGIGGVGGGFVGVDIFFVISGYLITSIIWREMEAGDFSLVRFYERRVRRILPALLTVLVVVLVGAALLFLPRDFARLPAAVAASLGFVSNILFWTQADYFDFESRSNPLLHTWSLAVEEQFYLLFPMLMLLLRRYFPGRLRTAIVGVAGLSFAASAWGAFHAPVFTFYMAPTRLWELLAGSLLALGALPELTRQSAREAAAAIGLGLIAMSVALYTEETPFPGVAALMPVLGTALVIHAGATTTGGRLLSLPVLRGVGLISYSLYLWHWPVVVFAEYWRSAPLAGWSALAAVATSMLLAWLSWRCVERPFRLGRLERRHVPRRRIFQLAAAGAAAICGVDALAWASNGWPSRFEPEVRRLESFADSHNPRRSQCHLRLGTCSYGAPVPPAVALWGDSHGINIVAGLAPLARERGLAIAQFTYSACAPVLGEFRHKHDGCADFNRRTLRTLLGTPRFRTVLLVANFDNERYRGDPSFYDAYAETVAALRRAGRQVVVYPLPVHPAPVPRALAIARLSGREDFGVSRRDYLRRNRELLAFLDRLAAVARVRPHERLCSRERCAVEAGGNVLYRDSSHLSMEGAAFLAPVFAPVLERAAATASRR
jgi:peptidoglycan/LPS O-acetylase OafA/YrhL